MTNTTYNRSQIMKLAHTLFRNRNSQVREQLKHIPAGHKLYNVVASKLIPFAECLKESWARAKAEVANAIARASNAEIAAEIDRIDAIITFNPLGKGSYNTCQEVMDRNALIGELHRLERLLAVA